MLPPVPAVEEVPVFDTPNILWHFGALSATGAGVAMVSDVHSSARGFWILLVALVFLAVYAVVSIVLLRTGRGIPGGILAAAGVSFVPLAVVGFERLIGVYGGNHIAAVDSFPDSGTSTSPIGFGGVNVDPSQVSGRFQGHEFAIAVATVAAGLVVYALVRYAFVFAWIAVATLVAVELLLPLFVSHPGGSDRAGSFLAAGIVFVAIGLYADLVHARRVAFWWHLVGLMSITGAFAYDLVAANSPGWVFALLAGAVAIAFAAPLRRSTWAIFGLLGTWATFVHYSGRWFGNLGTAFALCVIGLAIVAIGLAIQHAGSSWAGALGRRARSV
ncbi:MAG TPA: hypothetical protein VGM80_02840 [Gaiellaceae bacterium]